MPKITYLPSNKTLEVPAGQDVLHAALEHGLVLDHACGGFGACTTCHVYVEEGMEHTSPILDAEADRVDCATAPTLNSRLACQTRVYGDIVVRMPPQKGL